jgi:hypothetical protein
MVARCAGVVPIKVGAYRGGLGRIVVKAIARPVNVVAEVPEVLYAAVHLYLSPCGRG